MIAWILTVAVIGNTTPIIDGATFQSYNECVAHGEMVIDSISGERDSRVITVCTPVNG